MLIAKDPIVIIMKQSINMKKFIPLIVLLLFSLNSYSQWGVKGGVSMSTITDSNLSKYYLSGQIGGTYDIKLSEHWYLQPELLFTSIGCNLKNDGYVIKDGSIKIYALELPINLSFRPALSDNVNLLIDFGVFARYGIFGNKTYNYHDGPEISQNPFDEYNRFDTGLNIGLGLQKNSYYGIFSFQRGLTHAEKDIEGSHQVLRFSLGYRF